MNPIKPWQSFPEQLKILKNRGLEVDNEIALDDFGLVQGWEEWDIWQMK